MSSSSQDTQENETSSSPVACDVCYELYDSIDHQDCRFIPGSPVKKLISLNHFNCLKRLLQQRKNSKELLLLAASAFGQHDCIRVILPNISNQDIFGKYRLGTKALHMAARRGQSEVLKILMDVGIHPDCRLDAGAPSLTAVYLAAANGHAGSLKVLLDAGGQGSLVPGLSPIYGAVINEHVPCLSLLLKNKIWGNDQCGEVMGRLVSEGNLHLLEIIVNELTNLGLLEMHMDPQFRTIHIPLLRENIQASAQKAAQAGHANCLTFLLYSAIFGHLFRVYSSSPHT